MTAAAWDRVQQVNVRAPVLLTVALARAGRPAAVVNISSGRRDQGPARGRPLLHVEGRAGDGDQGVRGRVRRARRSASTPSRPGSSRSTARSTRSPRSTRPPCRSTRPGRRGRPDEIAAAVVWLAGAESRLRHRGRAARRRRGHRGHAALPVHHTPHRPRCRAQGTEREESSIVTTSRTYVDRRGRSHRRHPRPPPGPRRPPRSPSSTPTGSTSAASARTASSWCAGRTAAPRPGGAGPSRRTGRRPRTVERVLLAVKAQATGAALDWIAPRLAADGFVVSLQNGLNEDGDRRAGSGRDRTVGAFVNLFADVIGPGEIRDGGLGALVVGELDGRDSRPRPRGRRGPAGLGSGPGDRQRRRLPVVQARASARCSSRPRSPTPRWPS